MQKELINYLSNFISPQRKLLFDRILEQRTSYITVVLEDIYQSQNASAVLRTCDCFGIQNVHVIENTNSFTINKEVALGAAKWLNIHYYNKAQNNSLEAIKYLKKKHYRIVSTTPHLNDMLLPDFDLEKGKVALFFGSELPGVSEIILDETDEFLKIPMAGFTESLNISVSAAVILYHLTNKLKTGNNIDWRLKPTERNNVQLHWLRNTINKSSILEKRFIQDYQAAKKNDKKL